VPWVTIRGRKGGSTLVVAAIHALLGLAETRRSAAAHEARRNAAELPRRSARATPAQRGNRTGFTTGANSAAAARAATLGLLRRRVPD
jgi:hypothetical protein